MPETFEFETPEAAVAAIEIFVASQELADETAATQAGAKVLAAVAALETALRKKCIQTAEAAEFYHRLEMLAFQSRERLNRALGGAEGNLTGVKRFQRLVGGLHHLMPEEAEAAFD